MVGISIAARAEWECTLQHYQVNQEELLEYPFGGYFKRVINQKECIFYYTSTRKVNSAAANQYMILKYDLKKVIVVGTCAGIDPKYQKLDIILPHTACQYDCTVKEIEPLIKASFTVELDLSSLDFEYKSGIIGTADKAIVMWQDYVDLLNHNITIGDTESAGIAYVCKKNQVLCIIIKGISDFPQKIDYVSTKSFCDDQFNEFISNVPKVMKKIFDEYLVKVL